MPLSEHEQRMLEQMERALYAEDPRFAHSLRETAPKAPARRIAGAGVVGAALGVATLVTGLVIAQPLVGILGFIALLAGTYFAIRGVSTPSGKPKAKTDRSQFMRNAEERFRQRRDGQR